MVMDWHSITDSVAGRTFQGLAGRDYTAAILTASPCGFRRSMWDVMFQKGSSFAAEWPLP